MISFEISRSDAALANECAVRAQRLYASAGRQRKVLDIQMDLTATHANGCPLDFRRLLDADNFNFAHDVFGIEQHLDRDDSSPTGGQLLDCFLPRFTQKERTPNEV